MKGGVQDEEEEEKEKEEKEEKEWEPRGLNLTTPHRVG